MKLRKMLGDWRQPEIQALMSLIETQSKLTIVRWCITYARDYYLPIFQKEKPDDMRPQLALEAAEKWLKGEIKLPEAKSCILACHESARSADENPVAQAAARAIGQGASTIHVVTHALGIAFYGAAAKAYAALGTQAEQAAYDQFAKKEFIKIYQSLKKVSIANEPNPAKVEWKC